MTSISFTSLNHPIKPFTIKTSQGDLKFSEVDYTKPQDDEFISETSEFFMENFGRQSSNPDMQGCIKGTESFNPQLHKAMLECMDKSTKDILKDPDTTLLYAKGADNKLAAAILTEKLDSAHAKDDRTLYVDMLAVDPKYRHSHIGETLCEKVIDSSKDSFTDCMLLSYNESIPFYIKQGFQLMDFNEDTQKALSMLEMDMYEYPEYGKFMTKPIQKNESRWWTRV